MNLIKGFLAIFVLLFSFPSFANITYDDLNGFNSLSETQKAEVVRQIAQFNESSTGVTADVVREKMKEWGEIGAGIGMMLISTAKELGIAANEFAQTPLGRLAIVVGLTYMFGAKAIVIFAWLVCWFVFLPAVYRSYKRSTTNEIIEKRLLDRKFLWVFPLYETKISRSPKSMDEGLLIIHIIVAAILFLTGLFVL